MYEFTLIETDLGFLGTIDYYSEDGPEFGATGEYAEDAAIAFATAVDGFCKMAYESMDLEDAISIAQDVRILISVFATEPENHYDDSRDDERKAMLENRG